ncbi:MAG: flavodoxin family protein [Deltaproteobacteria bacterium]|jgi:multimeric flavodoxin WrbA|nr:flavodoxin family protein [Deltaproteobacteria bacterium]
MSKTLVIHDLEPTQEPNWPENLTVFPALPKIAPCRGCFGCWIKTPSRCVLGDRGAKVVGLLAAHSQLWVISRPVFGGLSPAIKATFDRSIGYILPFFVTIDNKMRHIPRTNKTLDISYYFYGQHLTETEKNLAQSLAAANATNFRARLTGVSFLDSPAQLDSIVYGQQDTN